MMEHIHTLVVEDDNACAEALGELLDDAGYPSQHAASPAEAIAMVGRDSRIGVMVLDLHLPEMDGLRLLSELRSVMGQRGASLQAVLCSGAAELKDMDGAMRLGVAAFLPKPVDRVGLLNAVTDAAGRYRELERDRAARSGLINRFRALEDGLTSAMREMAAMAELPPSYSPSTAGSDRIDPAPSVDHAWQALHCRRLLDEARVLDRLFSRLSIEQVGWRVLLAMFEADLGTGEAPATNIALASGASASAGLRRIAEFEERGLIIRREDPTDGRRIMLGLTETGRSICRDAIQTLIAARVA
jgi:two-component system, NarL family, response regulator PprB